MVTKKEFDEAKGVIKNYEKQMNKERQELFIKSLKEFDKTYWKYVKPMETIFLCAFIDKNNRLMATKFIEHSNGIVEIENTFSDNERMGNLLRTLSEYEHSEIFGDDEKYIFQKITTKEFQDQISRILTRITLSDDYEIKVVSQNA